MSRRPPSQPDLDPFADFRTAVDEPEPQFRPPEPPAYRQPAAMPPAAIPAAPLVASSEHAPRTRREAREAQARQAASASGHDQPVAGQSAPAYSAPAYSAPAYSMPTQASPTSRGRSSVVETTGPIAPVAPARSQRPAPWGDTLTLDDPGPTLVNRAAGYPATDDTYVRDADEAQFGSHHSGGSGEYDEPLVEEYDDFYDTDHMVMDQDELSRAERAELEREGKRRKSRGPRRFIVLVMVLLAVGLGSYAAWIGLRPVVADIQARLEPPPDFPGPGSGEVQIRIAPDQSSRAIGQTLVDAGVVLSVDSFVEAAKARDQEYRSVQAGDYTLTMQIPADQAVTELLDPERIVVNRITVPIGLRTDEILQVVADKTGVPYEEVVATALALPLPEGAALPAGTERPPTAVGDWEGWFSAGTFDLGLNPTPESILILMRDETVATLDSLQVAPADRRAVLTKASIVQKEALFEADFGKVARVVENRLAFGVPLANGRSGPQRLQMDSTTNYATGIFEPQTTAEQRESTSPYNTYLADGLPPGPIASPSRAVIESVLAPTPGPWLFFVTINLCTGETAFAETLAEHDDNRAIYQAWLADNPRQPDGTYPCT